MKQIILAVALAILPGLAVQLVAPVTSDATTTYTRVSVQAIDMAAPSLTFRTTDGQVWTLPAISADLLKGLQQGDTCSLEIDMQDRVSKVVKADSTSP